MIGTLARKRTNWVALAVLAGLVVALFAVLQSASGQAAALVVTINDTDNVVTAGGSNTVSIHVVGDDQDTANEYTITYVVGSSGIVFQQNATTTYTGRTTAEATAGTPHPRTAVGTVIYPPNSEGVHSITARVTDSDDPTNILDGSLEITVGGAGTSIGAAEVSLGNVGHSTDPNARTDGATTKAYGAAANLPANYEACVDSDTGTDGDQPNPACIAVTVTVTNSLGNPANSTDISAIHVFAPLAQVYAPAQTTGGSSTTDDGSLAIEESTETSDDIGHTEKFFIAKSAPGMTAVSAIVLGRGNATSMTLELNFTGDASSITLGEPSSALAQTGSAYQAVGSTTAGVDDNDDGDFDDADDTVPVPAEAVPGSGVANIEVTATDKSDNAAVVGALNVTVKNSEGRDASGTISSAQRDKPNTGGTVRIIEMTGTNAAPGTYTVTVKLGVLDTQTVDIVVAGKAAAIELELSETTVAIGDIITATATISDKDGNVRPDADVVTFTSFGALTLVGLGDTDAVAGGVQRPSDNGVATARFVVTRGTGAATIIASAGGVDAVGSVSTEAADAAEAAGPSLSDFANGGTVGTTAWLGSEASASELMALLAGRANIIWLSDGQNWSAYYAVIDGEPAPGSSDFTVTTGNVLYIGN